MKKLLGTALALGATVVGATAMAGSANAAVAYNVGVATDYVFRGIDQFAGNNTPEAFGGADWTSSGSHFYAGTWVSNTETLGCLVVSCNNIETDVYGGWKPVVGPFTLDLGGIAYLYTNATGAGAPSTPKASGASNFELKAAATVPLGGFTLGGKIYWTPHYFGSLPASDDNDGVYGELNLAYTFKDKATVSGAVGHQLAKNIVVTSTGFEDANYTTVNVGVTYPVTDHLSVDGRVYQTSFDDNGGAGSFAFTNDVGAEDTKVVGTLTVSF